MPLTIAIARQLACGASEVGHRVATALHAHYVDREVLEHAARELDCSEEAVACREEQVETFWERMLDVCSMAAGAPETPWVPPAFQPVTNARLFATETRIMRRIAAESDCVIIGRGAVHVLPPTPRTVNLLLYAPMEFRLGRMRAANPALAEAAARALLEQSDTARRRFVAEMAGKEWMRVENYHLALDTSQLPLDELAELLVDYVRRHFGNRSPSVGVRTIEGRDER